MTPFKEEIKYLHIHIYDDKERRRQFTKLMPRDYYMPDDWEDFFYDLVERGYIVFEDPLKEIKPAFSNGIEDIIKATGYIGLIKDNEKLKAFVKNVNDNLGWNWDNFIYQLSRIPDRVEKELTKTRNLNSFYDALIKYDYIDPKTGSAAELLKAIPDGGPFKYIHGVIKGYQSSLPSTDARGNSGLSVREIVRDLYSVLNWSELNAIASILSTYYPIDNHYVIDLSESGFLNFYSTFIKMTGPEFVSFLIKQDFDYVVTNVATWIKERRTDLIVRVSHLRSQMDKRSESPKRKAPSPPIPPEVKTSEEPNQKEEGELKEDDECVICMSAKRVRLAVPCGHRLLCEECKFDGKQCPLCRKNIEQIIKIF
jgi:hypothetical protein